MSYNKNTIIIKISKKKLYYIHINTWLKLYDDYDIRLLSIIY